MAQRNQSPDQQFKPLAPFISSAHFSRQEDQRIHPWSEQQTIRIKKFVLCCGCVTALLLIFVVILLVLGLTVYNVKEPKVRMNRVTYLSGTFVNGNNVTFLADISVKNTNAFTFRFGNTTSSLYYDGTGIGESTSPPGKAKARRTIRFNSTMVIVAKKLLDNPSLESDLRDQALNISSYTRIDGKVKIFDVFPRKVIVELNCTIEYNTTTRLVTHAGNCLGNVDI
ncbi:Late embryogenesis abundant protein [Spatholobus suberectus]|nr:Late embryogenesis abundant protein [Spatholobus suberectus]